MGDSACPAIGRLHDFARFVMTMSYLLFQNSYCCRTFSFPCVNAFDTLFEHLDIMSMFFNNSMHMQLEVETQNNLDNKQIGDDL